MTTSSKPVRSVEHQRKFNEEPLTSRADVIDFFKARDRLSTEFSETAESSASLREICDSVTRGRRSIELTNRLEQSLYWLISVPALAYLVLNIIGH
jgi:hypothetical protein